MLSRWRGLPLQLIVFIILPLSVLLIGIAFGSLALHQRAMRTLVGERDERATRAAAAAVAEQLNYRAAAIHGLALQAAATGDLQHALADATALLAEFEGGLALFSPDGSLLAATNDAGIWLERDINTRLVEPGLIEEPRSKAKLVPAFTDPQSGQMIMLAVDTATGGETVVGAFSLDNIARKALSDLFNEGDSAAAVIVDANGQVMYQMGMQPEALNEMIHYPDVKDALSGGSGTTFLSVAGEEHVIAFSPIAPTDWSLVLDEPWRAVADPLLRTTELIPLVLVPVLIIALVGLWIGVRQIVQPLQQLEQKATKLAWGDFEAIEEPVHGINEIQRLQSELVHMARKVKAAQQSLRGYLSAVTAGQEEERRRLARELHDETIQSLIALNQQGQLAQMALKDHPANDQLQKMQAMTAQMIDDLRRLTRDLRPIYLEDLGLVPALHMLARDTGEILHTVVEFKTSGPDQRFHPDVELALYRIAQEALSNVIRHSNARTATVRLDFKEQALVMEVADDGQGFEVPESPAEMAPTGHFGLLGMQERAELIGARLTMHSQPDQGTEVKIVFPL